MDRDQDVEVELYEENVGNLNYSTPTGSRSSSQDRFLPVLSSQEPTQRRLEEIPFVAIDPRPDPEKLSHAPTTQVPRIHDRLLSHKHNTESLHVIGHRPTDRRRPPTDVTAEDYNGVQLIRSPSFICV